MKRFAIAAAMLGALAAFGVAFVSPVAHAASPRHDSYPLHAHSSGPRVSDLQWLLAGHRPNVFTQVKPTFKARPNGWYGARTKHAVKSYKYRLGYPAKGQCGARTSTVTDTAGRAFVQLLEGKRVRPRCWTAVAAERVKGAVTTGVTPTALAIQKLELAQLGVHEIPDGSNRGPCISVTCTLAGHLYGPYQGSTGAFGAAWCASFQTWALISRTGHSFGSANNAYVPTIAEYAQAHNWLAAKPRFGAYVIFLSSDLRLVNAFHIGFVVRVTATGVQTIEGNYGNAVHEVWRPFDANHMVYIDFPGVA